MKKKAQVAFEFLATYGWTVLVILLVGGFIIYFTSDPTSTLPDSCILESAPCEAFIIKGVHGGDNICDHLIIEFQSQNPVFDKIEIQNITYEYEDQELLRSLCVVPSLPLPQPLVFPVNVSSGATINIGCTVKVGGLNINIGETITIKPKISYKIKGEVFTKYLKGEIIAKVYST